MLGFWEIINNPDFKPLEFEGFRKQAGLNSFVLTPKRWIETTNAIGIVSKSGRNGGTFAHQDIALEFASWISIEFKLYVIKEFQRLKIVRMQKRLKTSVSLAPFAVLYLINRRARRARKGFRVRASIPMLFLNPLCALSVLRGFILLTTEPAEIFVKITCLTFLNIISAFLASSVVLFLV